MIFFFFAILQKLSLLSTISSTTQFSTEVHLAMEIYYVDASCTASTEIITLGELVAEQKPPWHSLSFFVLKLYGSVRILRYKREF